MNSYTKKIFIPLLSVTIIIIIALVMMSPGAVATFLSRAFQTVTGRYGSTYRYTIAYSLALAAFIGMMASFLLKTPFIKKWGILGQSTESNKETSPLSPQTQNTTLSDGLKKYQNHIALSFALLSIVFFFTLPFIFAFGFASLSAIVSWCLFIENKRKLLILGLIILLAFWCHYLFIGQETHPKIFDNLDCHIPQTKILAESGNAFNLNPGTKLDNLINGIQLSGVDSGYNVLTWLFMIFPPFTAYALNDLFMRLFAYFGMILLLSHYILPKEVRERYYWVIIGAALSFSLLPYYPAGGLSIAGIPLLLYAFLNLRSGEKKLRDFLIIFAFPFYSKLALAGFFIAIVLFIIYLLDILKTRKFNLYYFFGLALLTVTYMFTHFHLVYSFLSPAFVSSRTEIKILGIPTGQAIEGTIWNFLFDKTNITNAQQLFVIGAVALAMWIGIFIKANTKRLNTLLILCFITAAMWGFKYWEPVMPLREKFQLLNAFDFSRFYWLNPFAWYLVFALALGVIAKIKKGKVIPSILIIGQILFMFSFYNWEYRHRLGIKASFSGNSLGYSLTYREFYSEKLFDEIAQFIDKPKKDYRVVSLGLLPGISQYNGFYTLDIYTDVYPLDYKHQFRKIIEKEIEKSESVRRLFDENGKRCFLLSSELHGNKRPSGLFNRGIVKYGKTIKIKHLEIDTSAFKEMGGEYIFSAVKIINAESNHLELAKVFERKDSPWRIFLYRAI